MSKKSKKKGLHADSALRNKWVLLSIGFIVALAVIWSLNSFAGRKPVAPIIIPPKGKITPYTRELRLGDTDSQVPQIRAELSSVCKNTRLHGTTYRYDMNTSRMVRNFKASLPVAFRKTNRITVNNRLDKKTRAELNRIYNAGPFLETQKINCR